MNLKEILDWFSDRPIHFGMCSLMVAAMAISAAVCVSSMSSCAAKSDEARYKYHAESDKAFWTRNKSE